MQILYTNRNKEIARERKNKVLSNREGNSLNLTLDSLMKQLRNIYRVRAISFEDSYIHEVKKYYNLISASPKTRDLNKRDRIFVISVVSEKAAATARKRRSNVIDADLFKETLLGYKGPFRRPDDKCEDAAIEIFRNRKLYEKELSKQLRSLFRRE